MKVAVVGGGVTGLVAALRLQDAGVDTTLFEGAERLGGKIHTIPLGHAHLEEGPDAMRPRSPHPMRLLERVGLAGDLVTPAVFGAMVAWDGALHPMPEGTLLGVPLSRRAIAEANMLSRGGRMRAMTEILRRRPLSGGDISVGTFVRQRFGAQVLERMVDPLLAGTRAGDVEELSLAAALREVDEITRSRPSLLRGGKSAPSNVTLVPPRHVGGFIAPRGGMEQFMTGLASAIGDVDVRLATPIDSIRGEADKVHIDGEVFDAAIVTLPAHRSAHVLSPGHAEAARLLGRITHATSVVVNLAFDPSDIALPAAGSGLLIPSRQRRDLTAATWFTRKWPHVRPRDGREIVRLFTGHPRGRALADLDDAGVTEHLMRDLSMHVKVGQPELLSVRRWIDGMPQYKVGHLDLVRQIKRSLPPSIQVAGTDLDGTGIPDCIRQAGRAVAEVLQPRD